ncbi:MAG TPA: hypothetical protein PKC39_01310 [Ferruginibacter sp.]|nr:hypothetical protein [Ferruginibacter sp.]HMP19571.1 hypothetical protein [Ferruginibacter sp.]
MDEIITALTNANSLAGIENIKKIKGHKDCYQIRIGDYRLGLFLSGKKSGLPGSCTGEKFTGTFHNLKIIPQLVQVYKRSFVAQAILSLPTKNHSAAIIAE